MVLLSVLALASAISTVQLTNYLERTVSLLRTNLESVRAAQQIEIDLLAYARTSDPVVLGLFEADLLGELHTVRRYVTAEDERRALDDAQNQIRNVFRLRQSTGASQAEINSAIETAVAALRNVININFGQAHALENEVARVNLVAERAAIVIALVLVAGVVAVLVWLNWAFRPLFGIGDAMAAFAAGNRNARAPEIGMEELRQIGREFNEMAETIGRQRERQMAFLSAVAHDLRNPLGALQMATSIFEPERPLPEEKRIREISAIVRRQIDHLNRMVGDLLDAHRIESGNLELRPEDVDARELLRVACDLFRNTSAAHELSIEVPETPVVVTWDPGRIGQVLNNLLSNAIKYSPAGGLVIARLQQAGMQVVIEVVDSGVGIPPDDIAHIFEPFRRSRLSSQAIPGVGLGMFVAQHIVEAHGGRIQVQSRVGVGTTFTLSIPRRASARKTESVATKNIA